MKPTRWFAACVLVLPLGLVTATRTTDARNVNAAADNVIAVHGLTNPWGSHKDDINFVRNVYFPNHSLVQMCGTRCGEAQVVAYDGVNQGWDHHEFDSPGCYLARKAVAIPGVNIAVIGHSMGGIAAVHLIKDVATGFSGGWHCGVDTRTAASWILNIHTIASPFEGSNAADTMFNVLSCAIPNFATLCGPLHTLALPVGVSTSTFSVRPFVADQKFDTWVANTGSWPVYTSWGTDQQGFPMNLLATCSCMTGTHDGVVNDWSAKASHHRKPASWHLGISKAVNHLNEVDGNARACGSYSCNTTAAQDIWSHDPY